MNSYTCLANESILYKFSENIGQVILLKKNPGLKNSAIIFSSIVTRGSSLAQKRRKWPFGNRFFGRLGPSLTVQQQQQL